MFATEEKLRQSFVSSACPSLWTRRWDSPARTFQESTCSNGRADWVWSAFRSRTAKPRATAELLQQPTCSRILAALKTNVPRRQEHLEARLGVAPATVRRYLRELVELSLIRELDDRRFVLGKSFAVPCVEICSFEFKLHYWQRALFQAKRYRTFSHRVYVVAPPSTVERMLSSLDSFRRFGIGIISHCPDGHSRRLLAAPKRLPLSRPNFIQAVGMLTSQDAQPAMR